MKKIYFAFALLITLSGCSIFRQPEVLISSNLDYSEYLKTGFFLTESNSVNFEYVPISSVSSLHLSGYKTKQSAYKSADDDVYEYSQTEYSNKRTSTYVKATREQVLDKLIEQAKSKNANAIINLKIEPVMNAVPNVGLIVAGWSATGMAVKK